ncbi:MAG: DNA-directed RNA polymerase subunit beta [Candidatus Krumholzibacteria bacterium]|nr:DNA-directed RNA polymerase subunit beta [Candidatus Krumholzibacteria bacterium]MDP7022587.1 DNA-directed RNA polymerase subunit beta [Candidatus Krumholzibacteria bacterium]
MGIPENSSRRNYSKLTPVMEIPDLLAVQVESFNNFLQSRTASRQRKNEGLQAVFESVFPIESARSDFILEYLDYSVGEPKYSVEECQERDLTFVAPLKSRLRLIVKETPEGETESRVKDIIESEVYLGELPLLTSKGTFVINGAERVIVSQLHRSPGVFFSESVHPNGKLLYSARIIPYRGSWVEFTTDINDTMFVHIDRKKKLPVTILLRAVGYDSDAKLLKAFCSFEQLSITKRTSKSDADLVDRIIIGDIFNPETGEILAESGSPVTEALLALMRQVKTYDMELLSGEGDMRSKVILNTLAKDPTKSEEEALKYIYNLLRPGDPPNIETARALLDRLFFNEKRYDLAGVGRYKINTRLNLDVSIGTTVLTPTDIVAVIEYLLGIKAKDGRHYMTDDIDHLGNRRIRSVGELLGNQFSLGLSRMARIIKERMALQDSDSVTPADLVNARTISAVIQSFFGSSQLSQFMDQTNPLSELTHKRRLSALGPGGLTRERAGFEVRDVHYTHYGRMCPIETPEGPNIGLITSLSTYARVNPFGFLETPYRVVKKGRATDEIEFLSADEEDRVLIAQANAPLDTRARFVNDQVLSREQGEFPLAQSSEVEYMDVSPTQMVSAAASLIPFLEHDDANRALMGCNMQRQAVPLLRTESPLVGTGMEDRVARDSQAVVVASRAGTIQSVTGDQIIVQPSRSRSSDLEDYSGFEGQDVYRLQKFRRSNQDTCINQRATVKPGDKVTTGQVIADGPGTEKGELALGQNVLVSFMPWGGYNYEDAILLSDNLVKHDRFTSVHIEEFECQVREIKAGREEITREVPNEREDLLKDLDEDGVIRIGAHVRPGNILVGKVTPKGETELSPEERLLRAIFGDKAGDVRNASLKAPPGMDGIVVDVKTFSRKERTDQARREEGRRLEKLEKNAKEERKRIMKIRETRLREKMIGQTCQKLVHAETGEVLVRKGRKISEALFDELDLNGLHWGLPIVQDLPTDKHIKLIVDGAHRALEKVERDLEKEKDRLQLGDELPAGVIQMVKVYVARKRKLSVGDKMAGRHGNKGVIAKILPEEDMPYLPDGTPVQIVLNPLGVPSRMNVGQVLETHLGWAMEMLGLKASTGVFDGASIDEVRAALREANLPETGKTPLYDGRTGDAFGDEVTVGYIYMMKLSHLVDDKIHARSIGPYSLVTQQPLGGKAQFGGQRFGEMEVWALEAYGAAHTLQELLTVKSDDVAGRSAVYEALVKGENPPKPGVPESFNVLVKELQALCLDVELEKA